MQVLGRIWVFNLSALWNNSRLCLKVSRVAQDEAGAWHRCWAVSSLGWGQGTKAEAEQLAEKLIGVPSKR